MSRDERTAQALELARQARRQIELSDEAPDPVAQRKYDVAAAHLYRRAADWLDDEGRITE